MQIINPDYKYYQILNGEWKADDQKSRIIIQDGKIKFFIEPDISVETYFCCRSFPNLWLGEQPMPGEEFRMGLSEQGLRDWQGNVIFKLPFVWYGNKSVHARLLHMQSNTELLLDFTKEPVIKKGWKCDCGEENNFGKFCINCGQPRKDWDCVCGMQGNTGKFCPNCGREKPKEQG